MKTSLVAYFDDIDFFIFYKRKPNWILKFSNNAAFKRMFIIHTYCTLFIKVLKLTT